VRIKDSPVNGTSVTVFRLISVDRGQLVWRGLKDVAIVMDLHELAPVGGRGNRPKLPSDLSGEDVRTILERLGMTTQPQRLVDRDE
jgi:hypothetical protein